MHDHTPPAAITGVTGTTTPNAETNAALAEVMHAQVPAVIPADENDLDQEEEDDT